MSTIFSKIISGEIPCYKIAEDNRFLAFLDIQPLQRGHVLVIPKEEVDAFFDLEDSDIGDLLIFAKQVAHAIQAAFPCKKIGVSVIGLEVPHAHIHLVPMNAMNDMNFSNSKLNLSSDELNDIATKIRAFL